jgi:hypothetical protein
VVDSSIFDGFCISVAVLLGRERCRLKRAKMQSILAVETIEWTSCTRYVPLATFCESIVFLVSQLFSKLSCERKPSKSGGA